MGTRLFAIASRIAFGKSGNTTIRSCVNLVSRFTYCATVTMSQRSTVKGIDGRIRSDRACARFSTSSTSLMMRILHFES